MYRGIEKKWMFTIERIWYPTGNENSKADVIRLLRVRQPLKKFFVHCSPFETVLTDITRSTEDILSSATKTIKYEVKKCEKEEVVIEFFTAKDLVNNMEVVDDFERAYLEFAKTVNVKMVNDAYQRSKLDNEIACDTILISKAVKDGVTVYHVYSCGGQESCLLYSVSNFRDDASKKNLAGRMNKLLHIKDMEWFREHGYTLYDWGNINSSETPNGIAKFKMSFGGEVVTLYNLFVGNSCKGKLFVLAYKLKGLI
jgi:lipid II:glycine glycyltransferase (peptidoglycan interpeptide bridge formation enzyme)